MRRSISTALRNRRFNTRPKRSPSIVLATAKAEDAENCDSSNEGIFIDDDDEAIERYPRDCYTILALNGPIGNDWPKRNIKSFLFGLMPFLFQMVLLLLLVLSVVDEKRGTIGENDNPDAGKSGMSGFFAQFIPANASNIVRATQVVSLVAYVAFPDSSLQDVITSIKYFPRSSEAKNSDPVVFMKLGCFLRGFQGTLAIISALLLVLISNKVVDVILNFTAINFISELDDIAFCLAREGQFSPELKEEAKRIEEIELPKCMHGKSRNSYRIVMAFISSFLSGIMLFVIIGQNSNKMWVTGTLRVQIPEPELQGYSGCFEIFEGPTLFQRRTYKSFNTATSKSSIGYCREDRQWVLFKVKDGNENPCSYSSSGSELARSTKTDDFDISSSFRESWVSSSNRPLQLYFFESDSGIDREDFCGISLNDGKCDAHFNIFSYQFDSGDCCSATCTQSNCGRRGYASTSIFGIVNTSADGFPDCEDPDMVELTIFLNTVSSSRSPEFFNINTALQGYGLDEEQWWEETPSDLHFVLECDQKNVLTAYIDEKWGGSSQSVKVRDGANCTIVVGESSPTLDVYDEPIWLVNYTVFHTLHDSNQIEIQTVNTRETQSTDFERIPECYIEKLFDGKLDNFFNLTSLYTGSGPFHLALEWLQADTSGISDCRDHFFIERYALAALNYAMTTTSSFLQQKRQCMWEEIDCYDGAIVKMELSRLNLLSFSEEMIDILSLLQDLKEVHFIENQITSLPSTIGLMVDLQSLFLRGNQITSVPTDIGSMTALEDLNFGSNIINSVPSEMGLMTSLKRLELYENRIIYIPTEIGSLTNLSTLTFYDNIIQSIPSEIGMLSNLRRIAFENNQIKSIPTEIGLITDLKVLSLLSNQIVSIPSEIGLMSSFKYLFLAKNKIVDIPSEIGMMKNLNFMYLDNNKIKSVPSEIGLLSNLEHIALGSNEIASIPSEMGLLRGVKGLYLSGNYIASIPNEVMLMTNLSFLDLYENEISFIPSEIGLLTSLEKLDMHGNKIKLIPSEIGLMSKLKRIDFKTNQIVSIPSEITLIAGLEELGFSTNRIKLIPSEIGSMMELSWLNFENNWVTSIPSKIGSLTKLRFLELENNLIASIPSEIGLMEGLILLDLNMNRISALPSEIGLMTNLESLHLNNNLITAIPSEIGLMTKLEYLHLKNNNLRDGLPNVVQTLCDRITCDYDDPSMLPPATAVDVSDFLV